MFVNHKLLEITGSKKGRTIAHYAALLVKPLNMGGSEPAQFFLTSCVLHLQ